MKMGCGIVLVGLVGLLRAVLCSGYDGQCFRAAGVMYQSDSVGGGWYMDGLSAVH